MYENKRMMKQQIRHKYIFFGSPSQLSPGSKEPMCKILEGYDVIVR